MFTKMFYLFLFGGRAPVPTCIAYIKKKRCRFMGPKARFVHPIMVKAPTDIVCMWYAQWIPVNTFSFPTKRPLHLFCHG